MRGLNQLVAISSLVLVACGGSTPPPEEPEGEFASVDREDDIEQTAAGEKASSPETAETSQTPDEPAPPPAPEFTPGMSVQEAINAVPAGTERLNVEQEALARPLMEASVYEPCKLGNGHFKLRVAIWDGRAVGIDVAITPKNDKLAQCLKSQIGQLEWQDKVNSLNTVEYQL
jgi:hypothetical protein